MDATLLAGAYMYHPIVSYHGFLNGNPWSYIPRQCTNCFGYAFGSGCH